MVNEKKSINQVKNFKRIVMSFADFKEAVDLASFLIESKFLDDQDKHFLVLGSLTSSMVIAYSRPFSGNDSRGSVKIPDLGGKVLRNLNSEEKEFHRWLLSLRNTLIAHSDSEAIDLKFNIYDLAGKKLLQPVRNRSTRHLPLDQVISFKELASKMLNYVAVERNNLEDGIVDLLSDNDIDEIISYKKDNL